MTSALAKSAFVPYAERLGLYIHVPYCLQRCSYCDFFTMPLGNDRNGAFAQYLDAVKRELAEQAPAFVATHASSNQVKPSLSSIFLGGGTPSLLRPDELFSLLEEVRRYFAWSDDVEVTLEVNPETVEREKAAGFRDAGVNRISMGVQSLSEQALKILGREHNAARARRCYDDVRAAGFDNVSLDMIYGRPEMTTSSWSEELEELLSWGPSHLSMYELILEPGTPLTRAIRNGERLLPPEQERLDMYHVCRELTAAAGLEWYEISNYALPGHEAQHNLDNWRGASYLGVGPGAHSYRGCPDLGARRANPRNMPKYLGAPGASPWNARGMQEVRQDILLNGLRLREGLQRAALHCYGHDFAANLTARLDPLLDAGYLCVKHEPPTDESPSSDGERWVLTPRGAELLDAIVAHLDMAPL